MVRLTFSLLLVWLALAADPLKRKHKETDPINPPKSMGAPGTPPTATIPPEFSDVRPTDPDGHTIQDVGPLAGAKENPSYLETQDRLGLSKACDRKVALESLFAFPRPRNLTAAQGAAFFLIDSKVHRLGGPGERPAAVSGVPADLFAVASTGQLALASIREPKLTFLDREKTSPAELAGTPLSLAWTPSGGELLVTWGSGAETALGRGAWGVAPKRIGAIAGPARLTDVSFDGTEALLVADRPEHKSELWLWSLATNSISKWRKGPGRFGGGKFSKDGKGVFFTDDSRKEKPQLYFASIASGEARLITNAPGEIGPIALSPDRSQLVFEVNTDGYSRLAGFDVDSKGRTRTAFVAPKLDRGVIEELAYADDGRVFFVHSTTRDPYEVWAAAAGTAQVWTKFHESWAACWPEERLVRYPSFDRKNIAAFLFPAGPQGRGLPAVVYAEGTPDGPFRPRYSPFVRYLVERSFTVLAPNPRGRAGFGRNWLTADDGLKRPNAAKDFAFGAKWLTGEKWADANRIHALGFEYGGWLAGRADAEERAVFASVFQFHPWAELARLPTRAPLWEKEIASAEFGGLVEREPASEKPTPRAFIAAPAGGPPSPPSTGDARAVVSFFEKHEKRKGP